MVGGKRGGVDGREIRWPLLAPTIAWCCETLPVSGTAAVPRRRHRSPLRHARLPMPPADASTFRHGTAARQPPFHLHFSHPPPPAPTCRFTATAAASRLHLHAVASAIAYEPLSRLPPCYVLLRSADGARVTSASAATASARESSACPPSLTAILGPPPPPSIGSDPARRHPPLLCCPSRCHRASELVRGGRRERERLG